MRILVLGGTGAMGAYLVRLLANHGNEVHVTSRSPRTSTNSNVKYLLGNAQDSSFLKEILKVPYDAVVDFMSYSTESFSRRLDLLLNSTAHYFFLSSCRVFADSSVPITESSPRLLDVCTDSSYLQTSEYALSKARQEDLLINSDFQNWTIVRPYITYSDNRLQLGAFEKEHWLYRALHGRTIVFPEDISVHKTSLTNGNDVATAISRLIGNKEAMREAVNIANPEVITWNDVLDIYLDAIEEGTGTRPSVLRIKDSLPLTRIMNNNYQVKYDRLFDRFFDPAKAVKLCGDLNFTPIRSGLKECALNCIRKKNMLSPIWSFEAQADRITKERAALREIRSAKNIYYYYIQPVIKRT